MSGGGQSKKQVGVANAVSQAQLDLEKSQLAQYNNYLNQVLSGGGYLPGVRQALQSQAIQSVPQQYNQLGQQLLTNLGSRGAAGGGSQPGSGLLGSGLGQLYSAEENQRSNLLNQITAQGQQNIAQAEAGGLNAAQIAAGVGSGALSNATTAAGNADQASSSLWGGIIGGGLGVLSGGLSKGGIFNK